VAGAAPDPEPSRAAHRVKVLDEPPEGRQINPDFYLRRGAVMKVRMVVLGAVSALWLAGPATAQRPGTIEVGGFARYTDFDNSLGYANKVGIGARIGVFLPARFAIEANLSRTITDGATIQSIHHRPLHLMLEYNVPASPQADLVVGGGYVHNTYNSGADTTDSGITGLVGLRYRFPRLVAARLDVNEDFMWSAANKSYRQSYNGNLGLQVGVSVLIGFMK